MFSYSIFKSLKTFFNHKEVSSNMDATSLLGPPFPHYFLAIAW